jgi:hypothetical protein
VGLAIVFTFVLRETGTAVRRPQAGEPYESRNRDREVRTTAAQVSKP